MLLTPGKIKHLLEAAKAPFDFLWFASFEKNLEQIQDSIPKQIGVLALEPTLRVIRHAVRIHRQSDPTEVFFKSVLRAVAKSRA
jgi:hypothetical protein